MSLILSEMIDSRESTTERGPEGDRQLKAITMHYKLEGTSNDEFARATVEGATTSEYDDLVRADIRIAPDLVDSIGGTGTWDVEVDYVREEETEPEVGGEPSYSFDTAGGTQHISQSIETVSRHSKYGEGAAYDFHKAINVSGQGDQQTVEGVDIGMGAYEWEETHYLPNAMVTRAYMGVLFRTTYKTNNAPFRGMETGETLFRGARGGKRGAEDWEISFRFAAKENQTDVVIGDITVPSVKGWEYLWIYYELTEHGDPKKLLSTPVCAYVEKVYHQADLSDLGIGN